MLGKIAKALSIPDSSKMRSTAGRSQTTASRASSSRRRLTTTSTPSAVESMKQVSERSSTRRLRPSCSESSSIHFNRGAVERSRSPSTAITFVRSSSSRHVIAKSTAPTSLESDVWVSLRIVVLLQGLAGGLGSAPRHTPVGIRVQHRQKGVGQAPAAAINSASAACGLAMKVAKPQAALTSSPAANPPP